MNSVAAFIVVNRDDSISNNQQKKGGGEGTGKVGNPTNNAFNTIF